MILKYESYELDDFAVFERVTFSPPFKPSVTYENEACFVYSLTSNGISYGGLKSGGIRAQESLLMKCGSFVNHWQSAVRDQACKIIAIHVTPTVLQRVYANDVPGFLRTTSKPSDKIFQKIPQQKIIDEYIKGLIFYFDHPTLINEDLIILKLKELILLLYNMNYGDLRTLLSSLFNPVELHFKSIIQSHLFEDLEIKDFAALTNTSVSTFKRRFKMVFNDTPARFMLHKRLEKAAELLKCSNSRIKDICFDCGFKDLSTFSKSFAKKYHCSPSEYRIMA